VDDQHRETILLVDDEPQVVGLVREMLRQQGFGVIGATDGEEALRIARTRDGRIDLLLTDIVMPQLNGRELADRMKTVRRGLRVLYMSGFMEDAILKYYGISIAGIPFLQKPFTQETLERKVREVLDAPAVEAVGGAGEMR
jgi:two-component system cell cycle sensor histidine kinase/response regulator CckA